MDFVVLCSSGGTTFQAVLDRIADGTLTARCLGLVTDRTDRGCVEKAQRTRLPVRVVERQGTETREEYDRRVHEAICQLLCHPEVRAGCMVRGSSANAAEHLTMTPCEPRMGDQRAPILIACIGWMWLLSPWFVRTWRGRILNVHPALLPLHPGRHPHEEVLAAHEKESGMTIHWVDEGIDTGPIIVQKKCSVFAEDTIETLKARVQELEKEWYPKVLQMITDEVLKMPGGIVIHPPPFKGEGRERV